MRGVSGDCGEYNTDEGSVAVAGAATCFFGLLRLKGGQGRGRRRVTFEGGSHVCGGYTELGR